MPTQKSTQPADQADVPVGGLDLDELEREDERPEPYTFKAGGQTFSLIDPTEVDWLLASSVNPTNARSVLSALLSDEDWSRFVDIKNVPLWKIEQLMAEVNKHYRLGEFGALSSS